MMLLLEERRTHFEEALWPAESAGSWERSGYCCEILLCYCSLCAAAEIPLKSCRNS